MMNKITNFTSRLGLFVLIFALLMGNRKVYANDEVRSDEPVRNHPPAITIKEPQQTEYFVRGDVIILSWEDEDIDDNAKISIAYDIDDDPTNDFGYQWIVVGLDEDPDETQDEYEWDTTLIPEGTYFIWAVIVDGVNENVYSVAEGQIIIQPSLDYDNTLEIPLIRTLTVEPTNEVGTPTPTMEAEESPMPKFIEEGTPTINPTLELTETSTPAYTAEPTASPTPNPQFHWQLEIMGREIQGIIAKDFIKKMASEKIDIKSQLDNTVISGSRDLEEIRNVLYTDLRGTINLIGDLAEIQLEIPIDSPETIEIHLESNLSTGYRWRAEYVKNNGVDIHHTESYIAREGIGVPYIQIISMQPIEKGTASIKLVYSRSFEKEAAVTRRLSIQFNAQQPTIDLSNPYPITSVSTEYASEELLEGSFSSSESPDNSLDSADYLPAAFDWRDHGGVTPIRNQRTCGSCWAFATVGAMESAIAIRTGQYLDLSEQFLVSCNYDGWNCDRGGGTAHKYHYDTLGMSQTKVGAVLEVEKPYTNSNGTCTTAYNHPYVLSDWSYIASATVDNLKSAIYTYGPIKVSVCIGPTFQGYTGGIFSTDESSYCPYKTNHAVNLVGWDDSTGVWILRNSWGTYWGEDGYMQIKYGTSNVGLYASWVTYPSSVVIPTPISPVGTISDITPTFTWSKIDGATRYQYQLYQGTTLLYANTVSSDVCAGTECTATPTTSLSFGDYRWRVCAYINGVWRSTSAFNDFSISVIPTPISPSGIITDTTPTFTWSKIEGVTRYQYQLYMGTRLVYANTVTSGLCNDSECSVTPTTVLSFGDYRWRVCAYVDGVWRSASVFNDFSISVIPNPISPEGIITDTTPTFTWTEIEGVTRYQYQLYQDTTLVYAYTVTSGVCGTEGCISTPAIELSYGNYRWRVCAYVDGVWRSASTFKDFSISLIPTPISPSGTITNNTPTFTWSKIEGVTRYQYQLYQGDTRIYALTVTSSVCGTNECSSTLTSGLSNGDYKWRVCAYVDGIWRSSSAFKNFSVSSTAY